MEDPYTPRCSTAGRLFRPVLIGIMVSLPVPSMSRPISYLCDLGSKNTYISGNNILLQRTQQQGRKDRQASWPQYI